MGGSGHGWEGPWVGGSGHGWEGVTMGGWEESWGGQGTRLLNALIEAHPQLPAAVETSV